jgi:hypothetical protein
MLVCYVSMSAWTISTGFVTSLETNCAASGLSIFIRLKDRTFTSDVSLSSINRYDIEKNSIYADTGMYLKCRDIEQFLVNTVLSYLFESA